MKYEGTKEEREDGGPNFAFRGITSARNIGKALIVRNTGAFYIRGIYVLASFVSREKKSHERKKRRKKIEK